MISVSSVDYFSFTGPSSAAGASISFSLNFFMLTQHLCLGTVNSNEAVTVSLVAPAKTSQGFMTLSEFHPQFTYPIFGTEESIFGYENLKINLRFNASDMRPNLDISYSKEYTPVGDTKATPIRESLEEFLPPGKMIPRNPANAPCDYLLTPSKSRLTEDS